MPTDHTRHCIKDASARGVFGKTLRSFPITVPRTPQAAAGHSAGLVEQAIAALHPLTQPRIAEPCKKATVVAEVLQEYFSKLVALQVVPRARAKIAPKVRESKKGRVELVYAGVAWNPERVRELRTKIEEAELMPYGEIKQYIVDSVASDRQLCLARSYLGSLYDASRSDGTVRPTCSAGRNSQQGGTPDLKVNHPSLERLESDSSKS